MRAARAGALLAALALLAAFGAAPDASASPGVPRPVETPRDADFGVESGELALERRVEIYRATSGGGRYERIEAASTDEAGEAVPLHGRVWRPEIRLDGARLDPAVVERLGRWRVLRPSFTMLPPGMAATFQPEGDGLGTAANPQAPEPGDLRVSWRELVLPDLAGRVERREGSWRLAADASRAGAQAPSSAGSARASGERVHAWLAPVLAVLAGAGIVLLWRRRRRRRGPD